MAAKKCNVSRLAPRELYTDEDILAAIEDIDTHGISIRAAGRKYRIPESTLRHKYKGKYPIKKKMGPNTLLTDAEEEVLIAYVTNSVKRAHPVTKQNLLDAVTNILEEEVSTGIPRKLPHSFKGTPQSKWWRLFKKRHPNLTFRTPETLTSSRHNISEKVIKQWFSDCYSYLAEENVTDILSDPSRNFNIDESGFSLSPKHGKVLAISGTKNVFEISSPQYKLNITVLSIVSADGNVPPPMIIYPRKRISHQMAEQLPRDLKCVIGKSDKGYISFETLYEFMCNAFDDWLTEHNIKRPIIVWTDWHETRANYYLATELKNRNIILYGLPPNTTHLMQPLDVAVFGPIKKAWSKGAKEFERQYPDDPINQVNFAKVFLPIYYQSIKQENIKAGFERCGLYPFDAEAPDFSKLESAAARHEEPSTIFEGIDQGGYKEMSCQTDFKPTVHKGTQTTSNVPINQSLGLDEFRCGKMSLDDMVLYVRCKGSTARDLININLQEPLRMPEFPSTSSAVDTSMEIGEIPTSTPSRQPPTSKVSLAFRTHSFYPERRQGKGPKFVKSDLDKSYAITSEQTIQALKLQMEEKRDKLEKKSGRGRGRKRAKPVIDSESEPEEEEMPAQSSSDEVDFELDPYNLCIKVPIEEPKIGSWVGVKIERVVTSLKGRKHQNYEIHIGKVQEIQEEGMSVQFLKEMPDLEGFYVYPTVDDISFPVHKKEMVVLQEPASHTYNRKYGFRFNANLKSAISSFMNKDN